MVDVRYSKVGVIGDNAHIEGGIHFHGQPTGPPLQLPRRPDHFTGRRQEVDDLMTALRPGHVITLWGPGGIGKSAVAAEALHRLTADGTEPPAQFPDGVVWHEFYNAPEALRALEHIARSCGQTLDPTPREAALLALAGRKALLLLDGAEDADDLPAVLDVAGGCAVIVTTRNRHDAGPDRLEINALPDDESADLLKAWGRDQTQDAPAVRRICDLLGGLPLAICLVGGYLDETGDTAPEYLQWLETTPLDALDQGDRKRDSVPLLLKRSLDQVSQTARDILSIAGILAFAPFTAAALAAALQTQPQTLKRPLNELTGYSLLARTAPRYQLKHALIHTYARENHSSTDDALQRLADFYTGLAERHSDHGPQGYAHLDPDRVHILQTLTACRDRRLWEPVRKLVWAIDDYLNIQGHWAERCKTLHAGVDAARGLEDRDGEGKFLGNLGNAYYVLGQVGKAIDHYRQALAIHREIRDRRGEGNRLGNLGIAYRDLGQVGKAIDHLQQALAIHRAIGDRGGEANDLGNLGIAYSKLGQVETVIDHYLQALAIAREIGDRRGEGNDLGNLGIAYSDLGQVEKARAMLEQSLAIFEEIQSPNTARIRKWLAELDGEDGPD